MTGWRDDLDQFFEKSKEKVKEAAKENSLGRFITEIVTPAFKEVADAMKAHGRETNIRTTDASACIIVCHDGEEEMSYSVQGRMFPNGIRPYAQVRFRERKGLRYITVESMIRQGGNYAIKDISSAEIIRDLLDHYMKRVKRD